jgi:AAA+ ATPase superfamily predicted ATPase
MFVGRQEELKELNELYHAKKSKLVVIYGRRRIGKSSLINTFCKDKMCLNFEGLEGEETANQIKSFTNDLIRQINDPILKSVHFKNWTEVFDYLTSYLIKHKKKIILFFDEFQWLAANQGTLVSLFKKYWDQQLKNLNVLIILCGSISSYMVKKVIRSKALYGRIDWEHQLGPISPSEAH